MIFHYFPIFPIFNKKSENSFLDSLVFLYSLPIFQKLFSKNPLHSLKFMVYYTCGFDKNQAVSDRKKRGYYEKFQKQRAFSR